jgi:hypothetical protein
VVNVEGEFRSVLLKLQSTLAALPQDGLIALILRADHFDHDAKNPRFDYAVVIDRASRLLHRCGDIWMGNIPVCAYDFECVFSVFPGLRSIHLHDLSFERAGGNVGDVRGKGIFSQFFASLAKLFAQRLGGFSVSTVAIEDAMFGPGQGVIPHLMVREFGAKLCLSEGMCVPGNGVYVDPFDRASIYIGCAGEAA